MQDKDIKPRNDKGEPHGYWESYWSNGNLSYKGNYINGNKDGYWESYFDNGNLTYKGNYNHGNKIGLWFENNQEIYYAR